MNGGAGMNRNNPHSHANNRKPEETKEKIHRPAPVLTDKVVQDGQATAYICENFACQAPVTNCEEFGRQLK
ncbi:hypothetical protein [Aneurinibacillus uraniidurans]|uniref:hypothetical protein n=1 Tax=Aneurinibacillus uraniidurans TaxID=2966586 RepID=UPI00234A4BC0|nr:hypothetical protein [Aneurinibacillus sp. B1]WCN39560.1 hypothetical protein PO771_09235 [Aneurinibacillus sp. B1]